MKKTNMVSPVEFALMYKKYQQVPFTKSEIVDIVKLSKEYMPSKIDIRGGLIFEGKRQILIDKLEDEWYMIRSRSRDYEADHYYKCDQFDELIQCFKKIVNTQIK